MTEETDFYRLLGVSPDAEDVVVRGAYLALMRKYHPDQYRGDPAEGDRMAKALNAAWAVLGDPAARARYDLERAAPRPRGPDVRTRRRKPPADNWVTRRWRAATAFVGRVGGPYVWAIAAFAVTLALGLAVSMLWDGGDKVSGAGPAAVANPTAPSDQGEASSGKMIRRRHATSAGSSPRAANPTVDDVLATASGGGEGRPLGHAFYRDLAANASQEDALYVQGVEAEADGRCEVVAAKVFELTDIANRRIIKLSGVEQLPPPDAALKAHILTLKALERRCKAVANAFR